MLTKLDIAAMRKADRIVFRHKDGKSVIEAIKSAEKTEKDPFAQDVVIFVETAWSLDDYADGAEHTTYEAASEGKFIGFEMIYNYGAVWKTVASLLRPKTRSGKPNRIARELGVTHTPRTIYEGSRAVEILNSGVS